MYSVIIIFGVLIDIKVRSCEMCSGCTCCPEYEEIFCVDINKTNYPAIPELVKHQTTTFYLQNNSLTFGPPVIYLKDFVNLKLMDLRFNPICKDFTRKKGIKYLLTPCSK